MDFAQVCHLQMGTVQVGTTQIRVVQIHWRIVVADRTFAEHS